MEHPELTALLARRKKACGQDASQHSHEADRHLIEMAFQLGWLSGQKDAIIKLMESKPLPKP